VLPISSSAKSRPLTPLFLPHRAFSLVIAAIAFHFMTASTGGKLLDGQDYPTKWVGLMLGMSKFSFAPLSAL